MRRQKTAVFFLSKRLCAAFSAAALGLTACNDLPPEPASAPDTAVPAAGDTAQPASTASSPDSTCAPISLTDDLPSHLSAVAQDLDVLEALPLTGRPVYEMTVMPRHNIRACILPANSRLAGSYNHYHRRLWIAASTSTTTTAHEAYHAFQFLNDAADFRWQASLTARDMAFAILLLEATAAAYELVVEKEAALRGVALPRPTHDGVAASRGMRRAFDRGYNQALGWHFETEAERQKAALQRGGQTAVYYLMTAQSSSWVDHYSQSIIGEWQHYRYRADGCGVNYASTRQRIFLQLGAVSEGINLTPPDYFGPNAEQNIAREFDAIFTLDGDTATCPATAVRTAARSGPRA